MPLLARDPDSAHVDDGPAFIQKAAAIVKNHDEKAFREGKQVILCSANCMCSLFCECVHRITCMGTAIPPSARSSILWRNPNASPAANS
jgi:hypothetical protein